jgi:hypothetical protein
VLDALLPPATLATLIVGALALSGLDALARPALSVLYGVTGSRIKHIDPVETGGSRP